MSAPDQTYRLPDGGAVLNDLPKVSLHDHLDGGLRPATVIELADADGVTLPVTEPDALGRWFADKSNAGSLVEYLRTFDVTTSVVYGEVRWAPEQHLQRGLDLDQAVEAVQQGIDEAVDAADGAIRVGQLVTAMRHADRGVEIAELALRHRDRGVVGFDIAGAEDGFPASRHRAAFDMLAAAFTPVTVHAGEAAGLDSIRSALVDGRALRLGHGVRVFEDVTITDPDADGSSLASLGAVASWVRDREIPLELSPSSNLQTGAVAAWGDDLADHPFDTLYQLGFRVTVNTDNRLMSNTSLSKELALLAATFGYDLEDLAAFQINAALGAFLPLEDREDLIGVIADGYADA
jgi:adenosine deaminase